MFNETNFEPVSYNEMEESQKAVTEAKSLYALKLKNYLLTCLSNTGLLNRTVISKDKGIKGVLKVESTSSYAPYELKFYPLKKDGKVSLKSVYVYGLFSADGDLESKLSENFEIVGVHNAS